MSRPSDGTGQAAGPASPTVPDPARVAVWLVLLAAAGTFALTMGTRQTMGLFLSPLNSATGLGLGSISLAFAFGQLWWGLTQPFAGAIADRIGAGRVLLAGVLLVALGTLLTPFMTTTAGRVLAIGLLAAHDQRRQHRLDDGQPPGVEVASAQRLDRECRVGIEQFAPHGANDRRVLLIEGDIDGIALGRIEPAQIIGVLAAADNALPEAWQIALEAVSPDVIGDDMAQPACPELERSRLPLDGGAQVAAQKVYQTPILCLAAAEVQVAVAGPGRHPVRVRGDGAQREVRPELRIPARAQAYPLRSQKMLQRRHGLSPGCEPIRRSTVSPCSSSRSTPVVSAPSSRPLKQS